MQVKLKIFITLYWLAVFINYQIVIVHWMDCEVNKSISKLYPRRTNWLKNRHSLCMQLLQIRIHLLGTVAWRYTVKMPLSAKINCILNGKHVENDDPSHVVLTKLGFFSRYFFDVIGVLLWRINICLMKFVWMLNQCFNFCEKKSSKCSEMMGSLSFIRIRSQSKKFAKI